MALKKHEQGDLPFYRTEWVVNGAGPSAGALTSVASIGAMYAAGTAPVWAFGVGLVAVTLNVPAILWKAFHEREKQLEAESARRTAQDIGEAELTAALHVAWSLLLNHRGVDAETPDGERRLRLTVHHVVDGGDLEQYVDYVGGNRAAVKGKGRKSSVAKGVVGEAVRLKQPVHYSRKKADYETFVRDMVGYGFSEQEARALSTDSHASIAIPLLSKDGELQAVVFLDSDDDDFFDEGARALAVWCTDGIRRYIEREYGVITPPSEVWHDRKNQDSGR